MEERRAKKKVNSRKIILFGGTTEGRLIGEALVKHDNVEIYVATEYGKNLLPDTSKNYHVYEGRLDQKQMIDIMRCDGNNASNNIPLVIDATHPYAVEVTKNIKIAARETGAEYVRILRKEIDWKNYFKEQIIYAKSINEAGEILEKLGEKALITTGSKELLSFTKIKGYKELFTIRILPLESSFIAAKAAGFEGKNIVAMQGPFSVKMNRALIEQSGAKVLVTKESGKHGGFLEKLIACREENIKTIVIKRPTDEKGYTVSEMFEFLSKQGIDIVKDREIANLNDKSVRENKNISKESNKRWFPIFMDSNGKNALVIGGGTIGERRIETLLKFQWNVTVFSKMISEKLENLERLGRIKVKLIEIQHENVVNLNLDEYDMVIATTDDIELNYEIYKRATILKKLTNDAACKENCNFYFPAVSIKNNITVGINGQGKNHREVRQIREKIDDLLNEEI